MLNGFMRERSQDKAVFHDIFGNKVTFKPFLKKRVTKCTSSSANHLPTFSFFRLLSKDQTNKMADRTDKMVTLTNPYDHNLLIENGLDEWTTKKYPDCILYSNDGSSFKIHKEVFCQTKFMRAILTAAKTMGFSPAETMVIEDSPAGVEAAMAANMKVLGFATGKKADILKSKGAIVISEMSEIFSHL